MNEIYNSKDLRAYADSHGPYMRLTGNIAPYGITIDLTTVPEDMIGMRGVVRVEHRVEALVEKLRTRRIQDRSEEHTSELQSQR